MTVKSRFKKRLFDILSVASATDRLSRIVDVFLMTLIMGNVALVILETVTSIQNEYGALFHIIDVISVGIFTVEYLLRMWVCTEAPALHGGITGRLRYARTPMAIADLLAILPFYVPMLIPVDLRLLRALRLFRLFRLLKLGRYSTSIQLFADVIRSKKEELLITVFVMGIMIVFASSLLYFVEHEVQPTSFSSIPASMWWGVATLTTVGYGDMYPITPVGKFCGALIAIVGIAMFAIPAGLLASGFAEQIDKREKAVIPCPHCGRAADETRDEPSSTKPEPARSATEAEVPVDLSV